MQNGVHGCLFFLLNRKNATVFFMTGKKLRLYKSLIFLYIIFINSAFFYIFLCKKFFWVEKIYFFCRLFSFWLSKKTQQNKNKKLFLIFFFYNSLYVSPGVFFELAGNFFCLFSLRVKKKMKRCGRYCDTFTAFFIALNGSHFRPSRLDWICGWNSHLALKYVETKARNYYSIIALYC